MNNRTRCLIVAPLLMIFACVETMPALHWETPSMDPGDYQDVLHRWTRRTILSEGLDATMYVTATLEGPEMRRAQLVLRTKMFDLSASERDARWAKEVAEMNGEIVVFVGVNTDAPRFNDVDQPDSTWRFSLRGDPGPEVRPERIEQLDRDSALTLKLYPYLNNWGRGYRLHFPRHSKDAGDVVGRGSRGLVLRIAGAPGQGQIRWEIR